MSSFCFAGLTAESSWVLSLVIPGHMPDRGKWYRSDGTNEDNADSCPSPYAPEHLWKCISTKHPLPPPWRESAPLHAPLRYRSAPSVFLLVLAKAVLMMRRFQKGRNDCKIATAEFEPGSRSCSWRMLCTPSTSTTTNDLPRTREFPAWPLFEVLHTPPPPCWAGPFDKTRSFRLCYVPHA